MEDAHSFVVDYAGVRGQGFFAIFDGHAGKHAAEWCGSNFHQYLLDTLRTSPDKSIPDVLNQSFHNVDAQLSKLCHESEGKIHSGCTAVTAFLRIEDADSKQSFLPTPLRDPDPIDAAEEDPDSAHASGSESPKGSGSHDEIISKDTTTSNKKSSKSKIYNGGSRIKRALKNLGTSGSTHSGLNTPRSASPGPTPPPHTNPAPAAPAITPPPSLRRVLYSANAGDARGVLCRAGKAVRLTYDHKGSDKQEAKRITDAGGFVMSGRVNGVLAVTRSLGDSSMKDFVVGAPYTTETELCEEDEFLILACDGLWDVVADQQAVDIVRDIPDAQVASKALVDHAMNRMTNDNVTVIVVRFRKEAERNSPVDA
jgi:protein phosphatase PTC1